MLHLLSHQVSVSTVRRDALLGVDPEVEGRAYLVGDVLRRGPVHSSDGAPSRQLCDVELGHDVKAWWVGRKVDCCYGRNSQANNKDSKFG